jgi:hypothetical protein
MGEDRLATLRIRFSIEGEDASSAGVRQGWGCISPPGVTKAAFVVQDARQGFTGALPHGKGLAFD